MMIRDQAYYSSTTPAQQLQDACDKCAEELARLSRLWREKNIQEQLSNEAAFYRQTQGDE